MTPKQARFLVGQRILTAKPQHYRSTPEVAELSILEVSPSGEWLKTMDMNGRKYWNQTTAVTVIEPLDIREPHPGRKP